MTPYSLSPESSVHGLVVIGEASHNAIPDVVEITLGAQTTGTNATQTLKSNSTTMSNILGALTQLGIDQSAIDIIGVDVRPLYDLLTAQSPVSGQYPFFGQMPPFVGQMPPSLNEQARIVVGQEVPFTGHSLIGQPLPEHLPSSQANPHGGTPRITGYCARCMLRIRLHDINLGAEVLDVASMKGANYNVGVTLKRQDEHTLRQTVLQAAGKDAQAKAEVLAGVLGKQLGHPIAVLEENFSFDPALLRSMYGPSSIEITFSARVRITYALH